jgi:CheY-like chemotaxis protein
VTHRGTFGEAPAGDPPSAPAPGTSTARRASLPRILVGLTVVVVDDDDDGLDYFTVALGACGAMVLAASTAPDALVLVREHRPHVVLSDLAMMGHDGYWLVAEIRRLADPAAQVPVVATTAYGREHSRTRVMAAGFTDLLAKPVDPELLCRTIAAAAGR